MAASRARRRFGLCYLVIGVILCLTAMAVRPGVYRGSLHGRFTFEGEETVSFVSLRAETNPEWRWAYPRNHRYQRATMTILNEGERTVQLDLARGTWTCGDDEGHLNARGLSRLLAASRRNITATSPNMLQQEKSLLKSLHQIHVGEFLRPRHHSYHMDDPLRASFQHFTSGQNWGLYGVFAWLLAWPVYLVFFKPPSSSRWLTPRRGFLVTGGTVVALDLIFISIDALFSPGDISEAMAFLIGLLNVPALIVLGDRSVATWLGLAFGAVTWSVLISVGTVFVRPVQRHAAPPDEPISEQPPSC